MGVVELQPDELEVLQAETGPVPSAAVHIDGPVRTQVMPHKAGATFNKTVGTVATVGATRLLFPDHRRAIARIMSVGQPMYVALLQAAAQDTSRMALWPANEVLEITADTEVWVASQTATTVVSVVTELWATGE